jgi:hypothetical protein
MAVGSADADAATLGASVPPVDGDGSGVAAVGAALAADSAGDAATLQAVASSISATTVAAAREEPWFIRGTVADECDCCV